MAPSDEKAEGGAKPQADGRRTHGAWPVGLIDSVAHLALFFAGFADFAEVVGELRLEIEHVLPLLEFERDALGRAFDFDRGEQFADADVQVFDQLGELRRLSRAESLGELGGLDGVEGVLQVGVFVDV